MLYFVPTGLELRRDVSLIRSLRVRDIRASLILVVPKAMYKGDTI